MARRFIMDKKGNIVVDIVVEVVKDFSVYAGVGMATLAAANEIKKAQEYFDKKEKLLV